VGAQPGATGGVVVKSLSFGADVVTGGAGFIGSHLVRALLDQGRLVRVVDNLSTGRRENLEGLDERYPGRFEFRELDIREKEELESALAGVDRVFHQAAMVSVQKSVEDPTLCHEVNVTGTLNVLEAARRTGVRKVVMASTCAIYGDSEELPKRESMPPDPLSPYAVSKLAGEHYALLYRRLFGLRVQPLRYFNVFGPRQDPSSDYAAVIPKFIARMKSGQPPIIFGDGEQTRDFIFVGNIVAANLKAASCDTEGSPINIGSGRRCSLNQLAATLNQLMGTAFEPIYKEVRAGDVRHSVASIEKARLVLGYEPVVSFEEGLKECVRGA